MKIILKSLALLLVISAVLFAAGCAGEEPAENEEDSDVAPEDPETADMAGENETENNITALVITEAENGTNITLKTGENFTLNLTENPSTGYAWELNVTAGLNITSDNYTQNPAPEGMTGVSGVHSWIIEAIKAGDQQVNGIYKRAWENTTGTEQNFSLGVEVV
ncbi:MAG: protease inhibitor I42 family protein [Methanosarcina sp.]